MYDSEYYPKDNFMQDMCDDLVSFWHTESHGDFLDNAAQKLIESWAKKGWIDITEWCFPNES